MNDKLRDMIADEAGAEEVVKEAREQFGMRTLRQDALGKVMAGLTTLEEAVSKTPAD
jgi:type II secretory ATPase GspE/PulE/Tfp pilus assembly ATPase PilB-like protein